MSKKRQLVDVLDLHCYWFLHKSYARIVGSHLRYFIHKHGFGVEIIARGGTYYKCCDEPRACLPNGGLFISMAGIMTLAIHKPVRKETYYVTHTRQSICKVQNIGGRM